MLKRDLVSIVIPAYNEALHVRKTINAVWSHADEIIVVDDCSDDETFSEALGAGATVIKQPRNLGYIAAIKRGFDLAQGEIAVTFDADGEFPSDLIPDLIHPIIIGEADMVQGKRDVIPRVSERFLTGLARLKAPVGDSGTGFRAIRTDIARTLVLNGACICGVFALEVLSQGGRIKEVPIQLLEVKKPRTVAWYHIRQFFYIIPWLLR